MKKIILTTLLLTCFGFSAQLFSQGFVPVPGACGNPSVQHSGGTQSPQDGSGTLGNIFSMSKCGLNYSVQSQRLGQRFTPQGVAQPAPLVISDMPDCPLGVNGLTIEAAYLWVEGSGSGMAQTVTVDGPLGPMNYPMTVVGSGPDKCWGYPGTFTYRADVTASIVGNATYNISGVLTSPPNVQEDMDGATLIIVWSDPSQPYQGTIVIDDGAIVVTVSGGAANYNVTYPPVCGATQNAKAFCCAGDLQMPIGSLTMNGTPVGFAWDWWNYIETPTTMTIGQTTSNFDMIGTNDCFNFCVAGMYYQTTSCSVCPTNSTALTLTPTSTQSSCPGCNGTGTVNVSPANVYSYSWNPTGQTGQTATNLCAGIYTVTVTGGCLTATTTVTVNNPANLVATASQTNVNCFGASTGSATVNASGGTPGYTYSWAPSGGTAATATGLAAGSYTCTTTDANGCVFINGFTITQPPDMLVTMNITNVLCNGQNNGTATTVPSGGAPPYTYAWNPVGGTGATASNLGPGNYSVTITDANGCTHIQPVAITQPSPLANSMTTIDIGCQLSGSATANTTGGTGPYAYLWSDGGNSSTDINLTAGTYTVLITDANGCTFTDTAIINTIPGITTTSSHTDITCFGMNNGSATVNPSGGNGPYNYSWNPPVSSSATASNLSAGQYTVTVTDANGCVATASFTLIQPTVLTSISASTNVTCGGGADGSGTVSANGGTGPYTYNWLPSGGTNQTANGLSAGSYTVTVTDSHGCITTQNVNITQPVPLTLSTVGDSACAGQSSTISANGGGGVAPYTYAWSNGGNAQTQTININTTTTFTVTVTDANSCTTTATTTVTVNPLPNATIASNSVNGVYTLTGPGSQLCFNGPTTGIISWYWDLNSAGTSTLQDPCVPMTPADVGQYCAQLVVVNNHGCIDTSSVCLEITDVYYSIPNVFSPNADGTNDQFIVTNMGMKTVRVDIYNRWGELVYSWDGPTGLWDGKTKNGNDAADGTYYYTVYMQDYQDKTYDESGFVELIRGK
jgi:gliding motility-associated-like protein